MRGNCLVIFILLLFLSLSDSVFSQGANCSVATPIAINGVCESGTIASTTNTLISPAPTCIGSNVFDREGWFSFTVAGGPLNIAIIGNANNKNLLLQAFSGVCGTLTEIGCANSVITNGPQTETMALTALANGTYFIRVLNVGGAGNLTLNSLCVVIPPINDNCAEATLLTSNVACINTAGYITGATASPQTNGCFGTADDDVWYSFVAAAASQVVTISNVVGSTLDLYHSVYSGTCNSLGTPIICSDVDISTVNGLTIGNIYYIRVFTYTSVANQNVSYDICVTGCASTPINDECVNAISLSVNSYNSCALTSAGNVSCASSSGVPIGACFGNPDDDIWYKFVATSGAHGLTLNVPSAFDAYMQLFSGICGSLTSLQCSNANAFVASSLTVGQTYYIRVFSFATGAPAAGNITLCIAEPPTCPTNLGTGNITITSLPYDATGQTTCSAGNDITASNASTCGNANYFNDLDKVYIFTPTASGQITVTLNSTQSNTSAILYAGCPFSGTCVAYVQTSASGSKGFCISVVSGTTYYLVIDGFGTLNGCISNFQLTITAPSAGVVNDLPCASVGLTVGVAANGDNFCSTGVGESPTPTCWTSGNKNTIWYSFVAPSPTINIATTLGTLTAGTQIALYSGICSSLVLIGCNEDPSSGCSVSATANSILDATGLTTGATYFIRVDGELDNMGTFTITVFNGVSGSNSPVPGQDCSILLVACNTTMAIGNPGYANTGNICDFDGANDCTTGEKNSVWYQINIANSGAFNFTLIPNNGSNNSCGSETDYDFLLWKASGSGVTTTCAGISANSATALLACNYASYGVTGIAAGGNAPPPLSTCYVDAFEPSVAVVAGDVLYLCVQNYTGSTQGFTIDFSGSGSGIIDYTPPTTIYWTGGINTAWTNTINWGSCSTLSSCGINAIITSASANQPVVTGLENLSVKDLTINPGATLTLNAGATLNICGNFINNGTLICSPTSTIIFNSGTALQSLSGNLTGGNKLGNLEINKTGGSVLLNDNVDMAGNFKTSNPTSIINTSGKYLKLAGNFLNNLGNTTFSNTSPLGTLEFNGTLAQSYNQGTTQLDLNKVVMNNSGGGLNLLTNLNLNSTSGNLMLTNGKITTNLFEVNMANTSTTAVSSGSTTSFVIGNLRRSILSLGAYDFPLGNVTFGFQRANINFTSATSIGNLLARFDTWPSLPPIQGGSECSVVYNQQSENNGYWTISANTNPSTGIYNMTLYPLGATNTFGMAGWTIIKDPMISSNTWSLNGTCVTSTATQVFRNGMSGFSVFGVGQSLTPLPIELISFKGSNQGKRNLLEWTTATEINNDYYTLENSKNGIEFNSVAKINGAGNSTTSIYYQQLDYEPFDGITFYRLIQTDFNGNFSTSETISIESTLDDFFVDEIFPNPTTGDCNIRFFSNKEGVVEIYLLDYTGRVALKETKSVGKGGLNLSINMKELSTGIYYLKTIFDQNTSSKVHKILKE